jgi:hypothetical protein
MNTAKQRANMDDDFESIERKIKFEAVRKTIKDDPGGWRHGLEELGFTWVDDDNGIEEQEELDAKPVGKRQQLLVDCFEGRAVLSGEITQCFLDEKNSENPNYPLIRRYFKKGNKQLQTLLEVLTDVRPTDIELLHDLCFFHHHRQILSVLIRRFIKACELEEDLDRFEQLVFMFYTETESDGYKALRELGVMFDSQSAKGQIVREMHKASKRGQEDIAF